MNRTFFILILSNVLFFCILLYIILQSSPSPRPLLLFEDSNFYKSQRNKSELKPTNDFKDSNNVEISGSGSDTDSSEYEETDSEEVTMNKRNIGSNTEMKKNFTSTKDITDKHYFKFSAETKVRMWIDVPNAFPWRHCLMKWAHDVHTVSCEFNNRNLIKLQTFSVQLHKSDQTKFHLLIDDEMYCVVPAITKNTVRSFRTNPECGEEEYWRWDTDTGHRHRNCIS